MALIEVNFSPSRRELRWFGLLLLFFFGIVGSIVFWLVEAERVAQVLWITGFIIFACYYLVRPLRLPVYRMWMLLVFPIGWVISHVLFGVIYYLILTPVGLLMLMVGRDPMKRRRAKGTETYWKKREQESSPTSYLRQF